MKIAWISAGVSSFISIWLMRENVDRVVYIDIDDQHEDSERFLSDCEKEIGKIEVIRSEKYKSVEDVIRTKRYINSPYGAPCTTELKKKVRENWERENIGKDTTYIWGYDCEEKQRADRIKKSFPEYRHIFPLIDKGLTKQDCHALLNRIGIKRPAMYDMGYRNNNCVGCVKGGLGYWNKIRMDFPDVFRKRAELEREIGATCLTDIYLDELEPDRGRIEDEISFDCSLFCHAITIEKGGNHENKS